MHGAARGSSLRGRQGEGGRGGEGREKATAALRGRPRARKATMRRDDIVGKPSASIRGRNKERETEREHAEQTEAKKQFTSATYVGNGWRRSAENQVTRQADQGVELPAICGLCVHLSVCLSAASSRREKRYTGRNRSWEKERAYLALDFLHKSRL